MPKIYVITFASVSHALRAEKILKQRKIAAKLIPVPRALSNCCEGLAAEICPTDIEPALELLKQHGVAMLLQGEQVEI